MVSRRLLRVKVLKTFYGYQKSGNQSPVNAEKEVAFSIQKTYDLYHYLLLLLVELADYAQYKIDLGKQKFIPTEEEKRPNTKFADNQIIDLLRQNESLAKYTQRGKLSWVDSKEVVKGIFASISSADYFKSYMEEPRSFNADRNVLVAIIENDLEDCELLYDALEDQSIFWVDDVEFVLSMILRTLKNFKANQQPYTELMPLYKNEEDQSFPTRLLRRAINEYESYMPIIEKYAKNWEVERIAFMDIVILQLAIAEVVEFPNIPVKVSIDEYIELSKYFSTPNSGMFINGVLDKVIQELVAEKKIVKTGRGLVG